MQFNGLDKKESRKSITKICFHGKKMKNEVGATKIQPNGLDKKNIRKRGYH